MKRIVILSTILLSSLFFYTCNKDNADSKRCKTCEESEYTLVEKLISNNSIKLKNYDDKSTNKSINTYSFELGDVTNNQLYSIANNLGIQNYFTDQSVKIISLNLYYNTSMEINKSIDGNGLKGCLVYYISNGALYTKLIKFGSSPLVIEKLSTSSCYISYNDIHKVEDAVFYNSNITNIVSLINYSDYHTTKKLLPLFTVQLMKYNDGGLRLKLSDIGGKSGCVHPCATSKGACVAKESQNRGTQDKCMCGGYTVGGKIGSGSAEALGYVLEEDFDKVRTFREEYLINTPKGLNYIAQYWFLSYNIVESNISITNAILTLQTIHNEVLPIMNKILTNPSSSDILYGTESRDKLLVLLETSKSFFDDSDSILIIENIKNDIILNANKTVAEVNLFFNT